MSEKDLYSDAQAIVTILEQAESQDERLTPLKVRIFTQSVLFKSKELIENY